MLSVIKVNRLCSCIKRQTTLDLIKQTKASMLLTKVTAKAANKNEAKKLKLKWEILSKNECFNVNMK